MSLRLRPAGIQDLVEVLTWVPDAPAFEYWTGPHIPYPITPEALWKQIKPTPENTFALVDDVHLLGFGQVLAHFREGTLHLSRIIVNPHFRGRGYGRLLCMQIMAAATRDYPDATFSLNVHPHNQTAITLYHSLGFRPVAHQPRSDVVLMIRKQNGAL